MCRQWHSRGLSLASQIHASPPKPVSPCCWHNPLSDHEDVRRSDERRVTRGNRQRKTSKCWKSLVDTPLISEILYNRPKVRSPQKDKSGSMASTGQW